MQDDKEYYEVFHKDTRNKRATGNAKGRNNAKETREKLNKLEKRHLCPPPAPTTAEAHQQHSRHARQVPASLEAQSLPGLVPQPSPDYFWAT